MKEKKLTKTHESEELNGLLGKRVRITFYDGDIEEGILGRSDYSQRYSMRRAYKGDLCFYKTHVKKVEEITEGGGNGRI